MAVPRGRALYKKKEGILTLSTDQKSVTWTPAPGQGPPVVSLAVINITSEKTAGGTESRAARALTCGS